MRSLKSVSIRVKILGGVFAINLLGALAIMVYLHQAYSRSLDFAVEHTAQQGVAAWEELRGAGVKLDPATAPRQVETLLAKMKAITAADYVFLLDKDATTPEAYAQMREALGEPNNYEEGDVYAHLASTDEAATERVAFAAAADSVPEGGKIVGVENGACSRTCHNTVAGQGDYWAVRWSTDSMTRGHAVFPIAGVDGEPVGVLYGIEDLTRQADAAESSVMQTLWVVLITLLVAALVINGIVNEFVLKRLSGMTEAVEDLSLRVAGGDFDAHYEPGEADDEIGKFETFFSQLMDTISATLKSLAGRPSDSGAEAAAASETPPGAAAEPAAAADPTASADYTEELAKLAKLHKQGVLTPEEFEAKKKQLLGL